MAPFKIIALGDSITYGYPFGKPMSWVSYASTALGLPILNQAINGYTLANLLNILNRDVIDYYPNYCIIMAGTNDICHGTKLKTMESNFTELIRRLLDHHIKPIVGLPTPIKDKNLEKDFVKFRRFLKKSAKENSIPVIDFYKGFLDRTKKRLLPGYLEDDIHPSVKGYQAMAEAAVKELQKILVMG